VTLADISILRTSSPFDYRCPLDWLPTSRLLPPRSGLERSDLVRWHFPDMAQCPTRVRNALQSGHRLGAAKRLAWPAESGLIAAAWAWLARARRYRPEHTASKIFLWKSWTANSPIEIRHF
jgi:hypothetical protein